MEFFRFIILDNFNTIVLTKVFLLCNILRRWYTKKDYFHFLRFFSCQRKQIAFYWSLSNSKSPQVSRTLLSILANLNDAVVWIVSTRPLISKSSRPIINPFGTAPSAPVTIGITITFTFIIILLLESFSHQRLPMVSHLSWRDSKSPRVSRILFSILSDLNNAVVCIAFTLPLIFKSSSPFINLSTVLFLIL